MTNFIITVFPLVGLFIAVYSILVVALFLIPRQYAETMGRPRDGFTRLRWKILRLLFCIIASLSFPLMYRFVRIFGGDSELLRSISSLASAIGVLLFIQTLVSIFRYKYDK